MWLLAATLAGCGGSASEPAAPEPAPTPTAPTADEARTFLVAVRDLPAGHTLAEGDLEIRTGPSEMVPSSAPSDPTAVTGQSLPAGLWKGQMLVQPRLDPDAAFALKEGFETTELTLPDLAPLLQHGDILDVMQRRDAGPCIVVSQLPVLRRDAPQVTVAARALEMGRLAALPTDERIVTLRGYATRPPPLPPCGEAP